MVLLNLIYGTYTDADILLTWHMEDKKDLSLLLVSHFGAVIV